MFSIGFKSGEFAGQSIIRILFFFNQSLVIFAVWIGALSCWNIAALPVNSQTVWRNGFKCEFKILI